ncbi:ABC transporter ATP-binding protein [Halobellus rubicundus]|uniref:Nickel import system ATP-binding protein NikD n=1 Tax=Halobellus rubicundus TaxID=2996466 RepID=A0ABD5MCU2_9EURY
MSDLRARFRTDAGPVRALDGVSFDVARGETVCLVGESGSGKTVASESITGLVDADGGDVVAGELRFDGRDLRALPESELRALRGDRIAHVFQNPQSALNPVYSIGWQVAEAVRLHADVSKREARTRAIDLLDRVGLPDPAGRIDDYPHELSGGMKQRVAIAMALAGEPDLLIADEPTTALDVTIQSQVLRLLDELQSEREMALLLVTHDLGVVAEMADRVVVLYDGLVMERGSVYDVFERPSHPYTRALLDALPGRRGFGRSGTSANAGTDGQHSTSSSGRSSATDGDPPPGCRFRARCPHAVDACREGEHPPLYPTPGSESAPDGDAAAAEHVASCVHFRPDGDPGVVYGSDPTEGEANADADAGETR